MELWKIRAPWDLLREGMSPVLESLQSKLLKTPAVYKPGRKNQRPVQDSQEKVVSHDVVLKM